MSLEKIVEEALAGRPLEMKEAFEEAIQARVLAALEEKYKKMAMKEEDDEDEDDEDDEDDMDESFDLFDYTVEELEDFIESEEFDELDEESQESVIDFYEGSIKGSGTDRKAVLKKAYRAGEQKTRDFYDSKNTKDPRTSDKGVKKAFAAGARAGDGSPTSTGAKRSKSQDSLSGTEHDQSNVTPTSKSFRSTSSSKRYRIAKSSPKLPK
jgi:hypothetical protein